MVRRWHDSLEWQVEETALCVAGCVLEGVVVAGLLEMELRQEPLPDTSVLLLRAQLFHLKTAPTYTQCC